MRSAYRHLVAAVLGLVLSASVASGQVATVRTGEHGTFTRLVIDLPRASQWSVTQEATQVKAVVASGVDRFDLSAIYQRITRDRIADVLPGSRPGEIILELGCDCAAEAFLSGPTMLVIDIRERALSAAEAMPPPPAATGAATEVRLPLVLPPRPGPVPELPNAGAPSPNEEAISLAEGVLKQELARAAQRGVLIPSQEPKPAPEITVQSDPTGPVPGDTAEQTPRPAQTPLRATLADRPAPERTAARDGFSLTGRSCLPDSALDLASWGVGSSLVDGLADLNPKLYGELDRPDPDITRRLARHYLHHGFGAEARMTLQTGGISDPVLSDLAHVLDDDDVPFSGVFAQQHDCASDVSLWAVLTASESRLPEMDTGAVMRAFHDLPDQLQKRLGPRLAEIMRRNGHADMASIALRRLGATAEDHDLTLARLALEERQASAQSRPDLAAVVSSGTERAPEALQLLIEAEIAAGQGIPDETAELIAAYAFEQRQGPMAQELAWTEVMAHAGSGNFPQAFTAVSRLPTVPSGAQYGRLFDMLTSRASDEDFLLYALPRLSEIAQTPPTTALATAERLMALGFPDQSLQAVATQFDTRAETDRRLLRARAALALSLPRAAEAELLGQTGPEVERLRAIARDMAGEHLSAAEIYGQLEDREAERRALFLARDWETLEAQDDPTLAPLIRARRLEENQIEGALARNRALLEKSMSIRNSLEGMLEDFSITPGGDPAE